MNLTGKKIKIIFASLLLASFVFYPLAYAQFGIPTDTIEVPGPLLTAALATAASAATTATAAVAVAVATGVPGAAGAGLSAVDNIPVCQGIQKAVDIAGTADQFSSFSLIGGSPTEAAQITAKLAALITVKTCDEAKLTAYKTVPIANLLMGQELTRREDILNAEINSLNTRIENLKQRQSQTFKDVLKAVALKLLLTYSQKLTTNMVNKLIKEYKITNFLKYADAVSTQIYTNDFVKANYPNSADQMIARSILQNTGATGAVLPMVQQQAQDNLGFKPSELSFADPDYYSKLAMAGKPETFGPSLQLIKEDQAAVARGNGDTFAAQEISQGKGFIPVRNCSDVASQQKAIDQQNIQASKNYDAALEVFSRLQDADNSSPGSVKPQDLQRAQADLDTAKAKLRNLPQQVNNPIIDVCAGSDGKSGIDNPAAFVGDVASNIIKSNLDLGSNLKDQNLPFYGTFIEALANNLISNIIQGKNGGNLKLLTEGGVGASNIVANDLVAGAKENAQLKAADAEIADQQNTLASKTSSAVSFKAASNGNSGQFDLVWDATNNTSVSFVTLEGVSGLPNIVSGQAVLTGTAGKITVIKPTTPGTYTYTLNLYTKGKIVGKDLPFDRLVIQVNISSAASSGDIFGVSASRPLESPRGFAAIHPRD